MEDEKTPEILFGYAAGFATLTFDGEAWTRDPGDTALWFQPDGSVSKLTPAIHGVVR